MVELKNDIQVRGTLKSVDQYLNIKLDDISVVNEISYPHLVRHASFLLGPGDYYPPPLPPTPSLIIQRDAWTLEQPGRDRVFERLVGSGVSIKPGLLKIANGGNCRAP